MKNDEYHFPVTDVASRWMSVAALAVSGLAFYMGYVQDRDIPTPADVRNEVALAMKDRSETSQSPAYEQELQSLQASIEDARALSMQLKTNTELAHGVLGKVQNERAKLANFDSPLADPSGKSLLTESPIEPMGESEDSHFDVSPERSDNVASTQTSKSSANRETADDEQPDQDPSDNESATKGLDFSSLATADGGLTEVQQALSGASSEDALQVVIGNTGELAANITRAEFRPFEVIELTNEDPKELARLAGEQSHVIRFTEDHNKTSVEGRHGNYSVVLEPGVTVGVGDETKLVVFIANTKHVGFALKGSLIFSYNTDSSLTLSNVTAIFVEEAPSQKDESPSDKGLALTGPR